MHIPCSDIPVFVLAYNHLHISDATLVALGEIQEELMATATSEKLNYPVISLAVWRTLRKKFQENPPKGSVNASYLSTVLGYKKDNAPTLIANLKRVGLINPDDAKLTDRAFRWRDDTKYKAVCEEILDEVYPQEVRDLFHSADAPRDEVERWFASATKSGAGTAANYARFYLTLLDGDVSKLDSLSTPKTKSNGAKPNGSRAHSNGAKAKATSSPIHETGASSAEDPTDAHDGNHSHTAARRAVHSIEPSLNINVQIHIPAEATPDQIDQIFKSMAKHLYQRHDEVGE